MDELGPVLTAMVTPFDAEGNIDFEQAKRLAHALLDSGSDGLVVCGTTGEAPTISTKEKWRLFAEVKRSVGGRAPVIANSGDNCTADSVQLAREAEEIGVDGHLLVVPYYNKPPQEGIFRHFEAVARAVKKPCILYNIPSRTGVNMSAETALRLSRIPNIVGIKECGELEQVAQIIAGARDGFRIWYGDDARLLPMLSVGAYGVISVASHLVGTQIAGMIQAYRGGQVDEAAARHRELLPLFQALSLVTNPIPVKFALNHLGFRVGAPRLPLVEPDERVREAIAQELGKHRIDLPVPV